MLNLKKLFKKIFKKRKKELYTLYDDNGNANKWIR